MKDKSRVSTFMKSGFFLGLTIVNLILLVFFLTGTEMIGDDNTVLNEIRRNVSNTTVEGDTESLESALRIQNALRNVGKSALGSVVNIQSQIPVSMGGNPLLNDELFKHFFGEKFQQEQPRQRQRPQQMQEVFGTGFVISSTGYIITNHHVVNGAQKVVAIFLDSNKEYEAEIIGIDEKTDLALIKIEPEESLQPVPLGDSDDVNIGDFAIAIGNPFGLSGTMTFGIVSAVNREAVDPNAVFKSYIQTDAPINQGNSGGPLLNIEGQVIGVNTMIYSATGGSIGIGFAIPVNIAKHVVQELITNGGVVRRGFLGVNIRPMDEQLAAHFDREIDSGVFIEKVIENTPAALAGIKPGDIVIAVDGKSINTVPELQRAIANSSPDATVNITVIRNGEEMEIPTKLALSPDSREAVNAQENDNDDSRNAPVDSDTEFLGMSFTDLTSVTARQLGLDNTNGILVVDVEEDSSAARAGIQPNDVILSINNEDIASTSVLESFMDGNGRSKSFLMYVYRNGESHFIVVKNQ